MNESDEQRIRERAAARRAYEAGDGQDHTCHCYSCEAGRADLKKEDQRHTELESIRSEPDHQRGQPRQKPGPMPCSMCRETGVSTEARRLPDGTEGWMCLDCRMRYSDEGGLEFA